VARVLAQGQGQAWASDLALVRIVATVPRTMKRGRGSLEGLREGEKEAFFRGLHPDVEAEMAAAERVLQEQFENLDYEKVGRLGPASGPVSAPASASASASACSCGACASA